jgi:hypothetical protein
MRDPRACLRPVLHGWASIDCDWPAAAGPRQLRGAVITALARALRPAELEPWCQRDAAGQAVRRPPAVMYRVHLGEVGVYVLGPQSRDLLGALAYHLTALELPDGTAVPVRGVRSRAYEGQAGHLETGWARYRLRTPYWPPDQWARRRPSEAFLGGWAAAAVADSLRSWCDSWGVSGRLPVSATVEGLRLRSLEWARPSQGRAESAAGLSGEVVTNILLPPGAAIGAKVSEGLGELDLVGVSRC